MSLPYEAASVAAVNRVSAVRRSDEVVQAPGLRSDDALRGAFARPSAARLPPQDVALFEQLVFGDAPHLRAGGRAHAAMTVEGASAPAPDSSGMGLQPADRIAGTLQHLGRIRGL